MLTWLLFLIVALLLLAWVIFAWRSWRTTTQVTPEEQAFDSRVAALNDRQANRLSDDQLTRPVSDDDAWALMVGRGRRQRQRRRNPSGVRSTRRRQ